MPPPHHHMILLLTLVLLTLLPPTTASSCSWFDGCSTILNLTPYRMQYTLKLSDSHSTSAELCTFHNHPTLIASKLKTTPCVAHELLPGADVGGFKDPGARHTAGGDAVGDVGRFFPKGSAWRKKNTESVRGFRFVRAELEALHEGKPEWGRYVAGFPTGGAVNASAWTYITPGDHVVCTVDVGGLPYCTWTW